MPRSKDSKVWNEDLVTALESRANDAAAKNNINMMDRWQKAAQFLESIGKEIYITKTTGKVMNLPYPSTPPRNGWGKIVYETCADIMRYQKPLLVGGEIGGPRRHHNTVVSSPSPNVSISSTGLEKRRSAAIQRQTHSMLEQSGLDYFQSESLTQHHTCVTPQKQISSSRISSIGTPAATANYKHAYLNRMKYREGGYALLMAFHHHPKSRGYHFKNELIRDAQIYSDVSIEPNFFAGRTCTAGWKSIDTLEKHRFVIRTSNKQARAAAGFGPGGAKDEFMLTETGKAFIQALIQKYPEAAYPAGSVASPVRGAAIQGRTKTPSASRVLTMPSLIGASPFPLGSSPELSSSKMDARSHTDERELIDWLRQANEYDHTDFDVSKVRRQYLHNVCDRMEAMHGCSLEHSSHGTGQKRLMRITLMNRGSLGRALPNAGAALAMDPVTSSIPAGAPPSKRRRIGSESPPLFTSKLTPREAAARAAELRQLQHTAKSSPAISKSQEDVCIVDLTFSSSAMLSRPIVSSAADPIRLFDDEVVEQAHVASTTIESVPKDYDAEAERQSTVTLIIDTRERTKNSTPRALQVGISRHLERAAQQPQINSNVVDLKVVKKSLALGDYAWELSTGHISRVIVERKTISDLVGRSSSASGSAHWSQLSRLNYVHTEAASAGGGIHACFLLEGKLSQANNSIVNGSSQISQGVDTDSILACDSREAVLDFIVTPFVRGQNIHFLHAIDPESTTRLLSNITQAHSWGGVAEPIRPIKDYDNFQRDFSKRSIDQATGCFQEELEASLRSVGVDAVQSIAISQRVAAIFSSMRLIRQAYIECPSEICRERMLGLVCTQVISTCATQNLTGSEINQMASRVSSLIYKATSKTLSSCLSEIPALFTTDGESIPSLCRALTTIIGPLSALLAPEARNDPDVQIFGNTESSQKNNGNSIFEWASVSVKCGTLQSWTYRVVSVDGEKLCNCIEAVFDPGLSDAEVASNAAQVIYTDIHSHCFIEPSIKDMILFSDVSRFVKRQTVASSTGHTRASPPLPEGLRERLVSLTEMTVFHLQYNFSTDFHVVMLHERGAVSDIIRALVRVANESALLLVESPPTTSLSIETNRRGASLVATNEIVNGPGPTTLEDVVDLT
jgi:hypothetical protein